MGGMNTTQTTPSSVRFHVLSVALELISHLREPLERIQMHDGDLARNLRRAASSIAMNLSEGNRRVGKDRLHLFRVAAGSAAEVRTALWVALSWGYFEAEVAEEALSRLDRVLAMTYRLTN